GTQEVGGKALELVTLGTGSRPDGLARHDNNGMADPPPAVPQPAASICHRAASCGTRGAVRLRASTSTGGSALTSPALFVCYTNNKAAELVTLDGRDP